MLEANSAEPSVTGPRVLLSTTRSAVLASQVVLYGALAICVMLMPHFLFSTDMGGTSNYGVHLRTTVVYTTGVLTAAVLLWRSAAYVPVTRGGSLLGRACRLTAGLYLLTLLTTYPYQRSDAFGWLHGASDIVTAVAFLVLSLLLARRLADRRSRWLMLAQLGGFVLLFLTYIGLITILFVAEVWTGVAYAVLLVHASAASEATTR